MKAHLKQSYRLILWGLIIGCGLWLAGWQPAYSIPQLQDETVTTIGAQADAYVKQSNPTTNYGTASTLLAQGTPLGFTTLSYIRFQVPDVVYDQVILSVYNQGAGSHYFALYEAQSTTTWSETLITYQNRPALGQLIVADGIWGYDWIRIDVTDFVNAGETVTFVLTHSQNSPLTFSSREVSGQAPMLSLYTGSPLECNGICPP